MVTAKNLAEKNTPIVTPFQNFGQAQAPAFMSFHDSSFSNSEKSQFSSNFKAPKVRSRQRKNNLNFLSPSDKFEPKYVKVKFLDKDVEFKTQLNQNGQINLVEVLQAYLSNFYPVNSPQIQKAISQIHKIRFLVESDSNKFIKKLHI